MFIFQKPTAGHAPLKKRHTNSEKHRTQLSRDLWTLLFLHLLLQRVRFHYNSNSKNALRQKLLRWLIFAQKMILRVLMLWNVAACAAELSATVISAADGGLAGWPGRFQRTSQDTAQFDWLGVTAVAWGYLARRMCR
jgi:hypothetical protein